MTKKPTGTAAGNSEAMRIYERMEEERLRKLQAKAEANKPKKVTLPKLKFLDEKYRSSFCAERPLLGYPPRRSGTTLSEAPSASVFGAPSPTMIIGSAARSAISLTCF